MKKLVVPAKAGTHTLCHCDAAQQCIIEASEVMGPRLRGDDTERGWNPARIIK
jgi:hypothetical protein